MQEVMSRSLVHNPDNMTQPNKDVSPIHFFSDVRASATGLASCRVITPLAPPTYSGGGSFLPTSTREANFGVENMRVQSPETIETSCDWQALPCEMVSSTPVCAHQGNGPPADIFDTAQSHDDNTISLELDPSLSSISPFGPVCKKELRELQKSTINTSSLSNTEIGTDGRGPLPSWSAISSSKDNVGDSQESVSRTTVGDSSTAFARPLSIHWQAVPEDSQLLDNTMVNQLLADRHLNDHGNLGDWTVQPGSISADTTVAATDDATASLRASEAGNDTDTPMDSATGEQVKMSSSQGTFETCSAPSTLTQEGLLVHLKQDGARYRVPGATALCVDNPLARTDSSTLNSARSSAPDPRKSCSEGQEGDGFRTHCNPLCNEYSPRPFAPPLPLISGGGQSPAVAPIPEFTQSPIINSHGAGPTSALNAETQTSLAESTHKDSASSAEVTVLQHASKEAGTKCLGPREKPRTTSCHVLHDTNISVAPPADFSATIYETCLEPDTLQCSTELSASSGSLLMADSHRIPNIQDEVNHSEMTQDGTTCLLSGMLSGSDSCLNRQTSGSDGLPSASLASSGHLSISVPARPQSWETGLSDSLPIGKHEAVTPVHVQHAHERDVTPGRHVYVSPRVKPDVSRAPKKKKKVDLISKIPTPKFRVLESSPLVPDERLHSSNTIQDDLHNAQMQPVAMTCSTTHTCTDKDTDASEQFACGPISSSMCDMNHSVAPHREVSMSDSVVESFQSLTDGKDSLISIPQPGTAGDSGVITCHSSMNSHSTASSCSAPSFKYFSSSTRDDLTASQFTTKNSMGSADESATSPTFRLLATGADSPKAFASFLARDRQSIQSCQSPRTICAESSLSRCRPAPLHLVAEPILTCSKTTPKDSSTAHKVASHCKPTLPKTLDTVDELTPAPLHPALAARLGAWGACHPTMNSWVHEPSPDMDITWTPCRDRPASWAPVLNYNSPAALEPFGSAYMPSIPTPSPIATWNRTSRERLAKSHDEHPVTPVGASRPRVFATSPAAQTPSASKLHKDRPWTWLCLKSPWASPSTDAKAPMIVKDNGDDSTDYATCMSPPVAMESLSQMGDTSSTLPLLPTDEYSHSLPLLPSCRDDSMLEALSSSVQLVSQGPTDCSNSMATGTTISLSDALLPLPPSESDASELAHVSPRKATKGGLRWRNQEQVAVGSSSPMLQAVTPPCGRIFGTSNARTEVKTPVRCHSQSGIKPSPTHAAEGAPGNGAPVKQVRAFLVPKRRLAHGRPGPVESSNDEDVNLLDGIVGTSELEEDALMARCTAMSAPLASPRRIQRPEKKGLIDQFNSALQCLCCMRRSSAVMQ